MIAALLLFAYSATANVTDTGDVVVDSNSNLLIGTAAAGQRVINSVQDGPYSDIQLGLKQVGTAILDVTNGGVLSNTGTFLLGPDQQNQAGTALLRISNNGSVNVGQISMGRPIDYLPHGGSVSVDISNGGMLHSTGTNLRGFESFSVSVSGADSHWIDAGSLGADPLLAFNRRFSMAITEGAYASHDGVGVGSGYDAIDLVIDGHGSQWDTGVLSMHIDSYDSYPDEPVGLKITNGGLVRSADVHLITDTS